MEWRILSCYDDLFKKVTVLAEMVNSFAGDLSTR